MAPISALWARIDRPSARRTLVRAVRCELTRIAGATGHPARAAQVLARRLERRLAVQGGPDRVADPMGWILGRGLPRREECTHPWCDDGVGMDTGQACQVCVMRVGDRRALRQRLAAQVRTELPHAAPAERFRVLEQRLRSEVEQSARRRLSSAPVGRGGPDTTLPKARRRPDRPAVVDADARVRCGGGCGSDADDPISGLCEPCARETRAMVEPELAALSDAGERLLLRLVRGAADTPRPPVVNERAAQRKRPWSQRCAEMAARPLSEEL